MSTSPIFLRRLNDNANPRVWDETSVVMNVWFWFNVWEYIPLVCYIFGVADI